MSAPARPTSKASVATASAGRRLAVAEADSARALLEWRARAGYGTPVAPDVDYTCLRASLSGVVVDAGGPQPCRRTQQLLHLSDRVE